MKKLRNFMLVISIMVIAYGAGYKSGNKTRITPVKSEIIKETDKSTSKGLDFTLFWDVWDRLYVHYLERDKLDPQKMIYGAISGMVASLDDPYTVFLPPEANKEAKDDLGGKFEGIGAQLGVKDKRIIVIAPLEDSPAKAAGILAEDWILKVDGKETINWTLPETVAKIRGERGSKVVLTVLHKNQEKSEDIEVLRDEIKVASVEWEKFSYECSNTPDGKDLSCVKKEADCDNCKNVYHLKLSRFGDTTNSEWTKAVDEIEASMSKSPKNKSLGVVFDVRNNPGGYLTGSVFIASEFLRDGTVVMQQDTAGDKRNYQVNRKGKLTDTDMVVLVNKGSASASEIVAGALRVRKKVKLVGETTFGKGTIQEAQELPSGAGIHITTAKWLLPDSSNIHGKGLEPDVSVANNPENQDEDLQLDKAVSTLWK